MRELAVLARSVGDPDAFLDRYWGRRTFLRPSTDGATFDDLLTVDDVDRLISSTLPHYPDVNLVQDGLQIDPSEFSHAPDPRRGGARVIDAARVYEYFHAGATIQMQGVHFRHPPLATYCRQLEIELTVPVQANLYVTPPHSRGLGLHADTHDVLVLQVSGTKQWEVFRSARPDVDLDDPSNEPPLELRTELKAGDVLYVPRGVPHRVASTTATSIHLTIGFVPPSWHEVVDEIVTEILSELGQDPAFRASLPVRFASHEARWERPLAARLRTLADRIARLDVRDAAEGAKRRFWADRTPILEGQLGQLIDESTIDRDAVLERRTASIANVVRAGDTLALVLGDRTLRLPIALESAVRFVLRRTAFTVRELDPFLDEESQVVLARRLVREGLLVRR